MTLLCVTELADCVVSADRVKREAVTAIEGVTGTLLDSVNRGVATVYQNQQRLEVEAKALQAQTARFSK